MQSKWDGRWPMRWAAVLVVLLAACDLFNPDPDPFPGIDTEGLHRIEPRESWEKIYPDLKVCAASLDAHVIHLSDDFEVLDWYGAESACTADGCNDFYMPPGNILLQQERLDAPDRDALWAANHEMSHHFQPPPLDQHTHPIFEECRAERLRPGRY